MLSLAGLGAGIAVLSPEGAWTSPEGNNRAGRLADRRVAPKNLDQENLDRADLAGEQAMKHQSLNGKRQRERQC